jgi:serine/threonine protein kinase
MGDESPAAAPSTQDLVGRGGEATVHLDRARRSVTKIYSSADFEAARRAAAREYRILGIVHQALRDVPGVASPKPIALHESPPGVSMQYHDGLPLARHLARRRLDAIEVARIAGALALGLRAYVHATGEAYYDFSLQNALIDSAAGEIVLVDFGVPQAQGAQQIHHDPVLASVGNFLGWSLYELARPANLRERLARRQYLQVYGAMRDALLEAGDLASADLAEVESIARLTYDNLTTTGPAPRRAWYRIARTFWLPWALAQGRRGLKSAWRSACDKFTYARSARATGCRTPTT